MTALSDLAELVRAPAALSVPGDALAGAAGAGTLGTLGVRACGLGAASVCLYWAGMAANDWADRDVDTTERPARPIPSGRVPAGAALGVAAGLSAAGLALAGLAGGRRALAVAGPLAGAVWAYDLWLKRTAAGPAAMAACRGLDVLLGASPGPWRRALLPACTVAAHTFLVTALSRREVTGSRALLPAATLAGTLAVAAVPVTPLPVTPLPVRPGWAGPGRGGPGRCRVHRCRGQRCVPAALPAGAGGGCSPPGWPPGTRPVAGGRSRVRWVRRRRPISRPRWRPGSPACPPCRGRCWPGPAPR